MFNARQINYLKGVALVTAFALGAALLMGYRPVHADIINPHPTPPADSVTNAMLKSGIITDAKVSNSAEIQLSKLGTPNDEESILFGGGSHVATSTSYLVDTANSRITAPTFNATTGKVCNNGTCYTLPATDGSNNQFIKTDGNKVLSFSTPSATKLTITKTAGGDVYAGDALTVATGTTAVIANTKHGSNNNRYASTHYWSNEYTPAAGDTTIPAVSFEVGNTSGGSGCGVDIYIEGDDGSGKPDGVPLTNATGNWTGTCSGSKTTETVTFSAPVTVTAGTTYHIVAHWSSGNSTSYLDGGTTGGQANTSGDGTTWTNTSGSINFSVYGYSITPGTVIRSSAAYATGASGFIGFAENQASSTQSVTVDIGGKVTGLSGLTAGSQYYLSDTPGALSTSAGSNSRKVCIADSTTSCIITNVW